MEQGWAGPATLWQFFSQSLAGPAWYILHTREVKRWNFIIFNTPKCYISLKSWGPQDFKGATPEFQKWIWKKKLIDPAYRSATAIPVFGLQERAWRTRPTYKLDLTERPRVECLRFFWNKFYIPVFFSQTWKKRNLEIVCVRIILFLSFLFCVLAV